MKFQTSQRRGKTAVLIASAIFLLGLAAGAFAQNVDYERMAALSKPKRQLSRPMLFFTAEKLERLRERIAEDDIFNEAWGKLLGRAERLLKEKLVSKEYAEGGAGQHGNYGRPSQQIVNMGGTLGLAYQMTGEKRYAKKLRDALIHYGALARWAGDANRDQIGRAHV